VSVTDVQGASSRAYEEEWGVGAFVTAVGLWLEANASAA